MPAARAIVTRPAREAARWVEDLRGAGLDAVALPLIAIEPLDDPAPLHAAWQRLPDYGALMFVSAAAVEHFFRATHSQLPDAVPARCWATGPGTAAALRQAGVAASAIDMPPADAPQFDSEALWACVHTQVHAGARVLIVRGGNAAGLAEGRDWLARRIAEAGGACDAVAAYRRLVPAFTDAEKELIGQGTDGRSIWLFGSSQAVVNLRHAAPGARWSSARALATHPRVAEAAQDAGFGAVRVSHPSLASLVASIESFA